MKIDELKTPNVNQNGYHKNTLTKERIGALFIYPIDFTPDDCLSCDGYSLLIIDYEDLYKVIGTKFNQAGDPDGTFRVPDYNITGKFLQPGNNAGNQISAGLPNIYGACNTCGPRYNDEISGAIWRHSGGTGVAGASSGTWSLQYFDIDASRCSVVYGNSSTVQPPSQLVHICIKYK